jgi:hypothetical protein
MTSRWGFLAVFRGRIPEAFAVCMSLALVYNPCRVSRVGAVSEPKPVRKRIRMKKIAYAAFASVAAMALAACGSSDKASEGAQAENVEMPAEEAMNSAEADAMPEADASGAAADASGAGAAASSATASAGTAAEAATKAAEQKTDAAKKM